MPKKVLTAIFLSLLIIFSFLLPACKEQEIIRESSVAGQYYPADGAALRNIVDELLTKAGSASPEGRLIALISPHAGYVFSGHVAAQGYNRLRARDIKTVIIIGAAHYHNFKGASVYTKGSWKTPLGTIKIDEKTAASLLNKEAFVDFTPQVFDKEHSLEVQIPFIQRVLPDASIVPILTGGLPRETIEYLRERVIGLMSRDDSIVLVASTDLSHYHDSPTAIGLDTNIASAISRLSISDIEKHLLAKTGEMCGVEPVFIALKVAKGLGANNGMVFKYADSGDITGDKSKVVGYASIGLYRSALTAEDKAELLGLARLAITEYITEGRLLSEDVKNPKLLSDGAAFVTINRRGQLRGCMGHAEAVMPLYKSVIRNAIAAAAKDPRFPPMTRSELGDMEIEVSVLSPLEPVRDIGEIEIGRDGLVIVKDQSTGLFLPHVPVEFGWDRETYLRELAFKAGLPDGAWKTGATLYKFRAEVIK